MRRQMMSLILPLATAVLMSAGCSVAPRAPSQLAGSAFLDDARFNASRFIPDAASILAVTPEMRRYVQALETHERYPAGPGYTLVAALQSSRHLGLRYERATRTAAEAFQAHEGDCLSLVLMTAALAREMGMDVRFQQVLIEDVPVADGDLVRMVGHVNIGLAPRGTSRVRQLVTVDFLPPEDAGRLRFELVSEQRIVAMYFNNKAVDALATGAYGSAYWWLRASIAADPDFHSSYLTLGTLWDRVKAPEKARAALQQALALSPGNANVIHNLALAAMAPLPAPDAAPAAGSPAFRAWMPNELARLLEAGQTMQARDWLERSLQQKERADLRMLLGAIQARLGNKRAALENFDRALRRADIEPAQKAAAEAKRALMAMAAGRPAEVQDDARPLAPR